MGLLSNQSEKMNIWRWPQQTLLKRQQSTTTTKKK
jgi:hypothetical protein